MSDDLLNKLKLTKEEIKALEEGTGLYGTEALKTFIKIALSEGIAKEKLRKAISVYTRKFPGKN